MNEIRTSLANLRDFLKCKWLSGFTVDYWNGKKSVRNQRWAHFYRDYIFHSSLFFIRKWFSRCCAYVYLNFFLSMSHSYIKIRDFLPYDVIFSLIFLLLSFWDLLYHLLPIKVLSNFFIIINIFLHQWNVLNFSAYIKKYAWRQKVKI